jgi:hypothetical protein
MCIELSRDASIQLRVEGWSVIPCGIGLFEIISILELGVADVFLLESGHVEQVRSKRHVKPEA